MQKILDFLMIHWPELVTPAATVVVVMLVGWFGRNMAFGALRRWSDKTTTKLDDIIIDAMSRPVMLWLLILGIDIAVHTSPLPDRATDMVSKLLLVLWIISLTVVVARIVSQLVRYYGTRISANLPATSLTQNLASLAVILIGLLVLLNAIGIEIAPILAALGVGGLAVALALQDTLSNLFAGFYISLAGQIRVGDYVKLDSGQEGYVADIRWRATGIRMLANNMIIVPNSKLAQAIVTNYHLPEKRMSLLIPIGVSYESDPEHIEKVLVEEALAGAESIPGLLAEPAPFVRFIPGYGDSSLNFTLICQVSEFVDQYFAQHELRKRIFRRFRQEGIEIPFPIRTVYIHNADTRLAGQDADLEQRKESNV